MDIDNKDPKGNGTLLHVIKRATKDWVSFQAIKPSHCHRTQTRWKNLTHPGLVLRMDGHFLTKMIDMFHWIRSAIIKGEGGLMKSPRKTCILYTSCEGRPSNLTQRFVHGIVLKAFMGWALILTLMAIFLVARESLTRWSFGSSPIRSIICILR